MLSNSSLNGIHYSHEILVPEQRSDLRPIKYPCFFLLIAKTRKGWANVSKTVSRTIKCFGIASLVQVWCVVVAKWCFSDQPKGYWWYSFLQVLLYSLVAILFLPNALRWLYCPSSIKSKNIWYDLLVALIGNSPFLNLHISTTGERSASVFQAQPWCFRSFPSERQSVL